MFRRGHSTAQSCFDILHSVYNANNLNNHTIITYIDFAKAFNVINHELLIIKFKNLGVKNTFLSLIKNYLYDRKQIIKLGDVISDVGLIQDGVPQGSILGPTLFLSYINDLKDCKLNGNINLYADDTAIHVSDSNIQTAAARMNSDLRIFAQWALRSRLTVNVSKTNYMIIYGRNKIPIDIDSRVKISYDGKFLTRVDKYTYLGLVIDEKTNFELQVNKLSPTTSCICWENLENI